MSSLDQVRESVRLELQNDARHWDQIAGFGTITDEDRVRAVELARLYHALDAWLEACGDLQPAAPVTS